MPASPPTIVSDLKVVAASDARHPIVAQRQLDAIRALLASKAAA